MGGVEEIIKKLFERGKGILATDAGENTMGKRFAEAGIENTFKNRLKFRQILLSTPGIEEYISGVILNDELIRDLKVPVILGVKVDDMGLEGLAERLADYRNLGAKFAKWRAVYEIGALTPTIESMGENGKRMGEYAKRVIEWEMTPIIEPEVLMDGGHDIRDCERVTEQVLKLTFLELDRALVPFEKIILKTNMVLPGKKNRRKASIAEVAERTAEVLKRSLPAELGGVVFLSGGQEAETASKNLNEIVRAGEMPWPTTFSFERALEGPAMKIWGGKEENVEAAQKEFLKRARLNSKAAQGSYKIEMEESNGS